MQCVIGNEERNEGEKIVDHFHSDLDRRNVLQEEIGVEINDPSCPLRSDELDETLTMYRDSKIAFKFV